MSLLVSVIVIVFNGERFLSQGLSSLMNLDFPKEDLGIIVVDNNSTDSTKEITQQFPVKYVFEPKRSPAVARNRGIKEAKGKYITFIDSDYIADKYWLKYLVEALENVPADIGAGAGEIKFHSPNTLWKRYKVYTFISHEERCLGKGLLKRALPHLGTANSIFKRNIFDEVGFFDENFTRGEDLDLCLRILLKGYKLKFIPQAIVYRTDYANFLVDVPKKIVDGQNIAKTIYKYKDIFKYNNIVCEYIKIFIYDFLHIINRYKLTVKEDRSRVSFLALSILFCLVQNLSLLVGILRYKGKILPLPKSFVECNKTIAAMKININGKLLSYNTDIAPLIFDGAEEVIFIDVDKKSFYGLRDIGFQIWELLTKGKTSLEIVEIISLKYKADKEIVQNDFEDLLTELKEKNILIEV